ncbi:MAG: metallophosphoesterase [Solobacterium sp.]|nr:metallophosphoesterase [Solobacterium sp.]
MKKKTVLKAILILLCAAVILAAAELWASANMLVSRRYETVSAKITEDMDIVILSDLHGYDFRGALEKKIRSAEPDLILMDGDMVNSDGSGLDIVCDLIRELQAAAPVFYSWGNHEVSCLKVIPDLKERMESAGCTVVEKNYADISAGNNTLRIGGLYEYAFGHNSGGYNKAGSAPDDVRLFLEDFTDTERYTLMLAHRPDSFIFGDVSETYAIDMVVCGHLHGGQIVVPFKGGLVGGDQGWFPEYVHGLYEKDLLHILITSGLSAGKRKYPRIFNRPEVMILHLKAGTGEE